MGSIVYTCHDAFPSSDINTHQIFRTIAELCGLGVDVELIVPALACRSADPRAALADYYGVAGDQMPASFRIRPTGRRTPSGNAARAWFDWCVPRRVSRAAVDLVWTRDPLAAVALVRAGLPTVFETFRPDFATRPRFALWRRALIRSPHLRGVIAHSRFAADAYVSAGMPAGRCLVAYNGFSPPLMTPVLDAGAARRRLGLPHERPLVVYAGHAARDKGVHLMIDIAAALPDVQVMIVGADPRSPEGQWIEAAARRRRVANLELRPPVRAGEVAPYLYAADCLVITPYDEPSPRHRRGMLPIKVYSYLAAGRPILAPRLPDIEEVLTDRATAALYAPDAPDAAIGELASLLGDPGRRARLSANALAVSSRFTWRARAALIRDFFESLAAQPRSALAAAAISR